MKKWYIELNKTVTTQVVVAAPTKEKAADYAEELYRSGKLLFEPSDIVDFDVECKGEAPNEKAQYVYEYDDEWSGYLEYLKEWAENHEELANYGQSPASFDEWCNMECGEEE